jgi:hypothetical protein
MRSQREVKKTYNKLLEQVNTSDYYKIDLTNRVNCYRCIDCQHITKTIDIDAGVTPMFFSCEKCNGTAKSSFYKDIAPAQKPSFEFYRPLISEFVKLRKNDALLSHVEKGGLLCRAIN